jgi:O-antigen ligase
MNSLKPSQWVAIGLGLSLALYFVYFHLQSFGDISFLGGIVLLEIIIASLWKYEQRFFSLLIITFIWAGIDAPFRSTWSAVRWVVLFAGAVVGFVIWTRNLRRPFGSLHLIAFFCVCAAFVSATVSQYVRMASLKASSLALLFLYCASGARVAFLGRETRFFNGLLWGSEIAVYVTAFCYFGLGQQLWGNPNSLGAAMSIGAFPILLWGWVTAEGLGVKFRRLVALLLCTYLVQFSMARAGMVSITLVTLIFCVCLRQYKLLVKVTALALLLIAGTGMLAPRLLSERLTDMKDALLYKGHHEEGILGSRRSPWDATVASIKEHPWFGTGYGTSPTGEDPGLEFGTVSSSAETVREHGSSFMAIAEWVGLLGVLPFIAILVATVLNVWNVCVWMKRTADPGHYSIPVAMVVLSGLVHANFEDWLFAVGSYLSVYFWFFAFLLADLVPTVVEDPLIGPVSRVSRPLAADFANAVPNR